MDLQNPRALPLLALLLEFSTALIQVHVGQNPVIVVEGKSSVLPVWYTSVSQKPPAIYWLFERTPSKRVQILKYMAGSSQVEEPQFKDRIQFVYRMPATNVSVSINHTREEDSGHYECLVNMEDDSGPGGTNIGVVNLTVLVPPSIPTCQIHGRAWIGGNVTLSCHSSSGKPVPVYTWRQQKKFVTHAIFSSAQDTAKGTLRLINLTSEMSGIYVCTATNQVSSSKCNITLEVTAAVSTAVIVGAVIGSFLGVFLVIAIGVLLYFYRQKKKEARDERANEIKEDAPAPKTPSWARKPGSGVMSKNGTLSSVSSNSDLRPYLGKPPSDTGSVVTTRSMLAYRPSYVNQRGAVPTPAPSVSSQPQMHCSPADSGNHYHHSPMPASRGDPYQTNGAVAQAPGPEAVLTAVVTPSNLARMGAVPVMVPAQSQAGSLV
ncbi:endothelial cell-selective adhesion molecule-like [Rhinatrema bivittatum]|uniref:endothelial cell-selective adhesion molecule-like n=1 Tax=Rhinatrema bivittatum TaxID=194408 RepID=UPI00112DC85A|nr:endothelial cell-selective adhesion molecule-like [Rhinatrema bivittatum]